jgi:K+/H+ antiporter YhaU regulatory subunit KhtT
MDQPEQLQELLQVFRLTATQTYYVGDSCHIAGMTIAQTDLRAKSGVSIIAVVREGQPTTNPPADFEVRQGDVLVLVGTHAQLSNARGVLDGTP